MASGGWGLLWRDPSGGVTVTRQKICSYPAQVKSISQLQSKLVSESQDLVKVKSLTPALFRIPVLPMAVSCNQRKRPYSMCTRQTLTVIFAVVLLASLAASTVRGIETPKEIQASRAPSPYPNSVLRWECRREAARRS